MGMARLIVTAVLVEKRSKSEVARQYGVSRRWVITLVQRYLAEGDGGLEPRSRRPHHSPHRISVEVEDEIVQIRKDLDRGGHEAGAATIAAHLERKLGWTPAVSTIWRILTERGFVTRQPHKRPKSSYVRFAAEQPNERWQADITHWTLADGTAVEILNWIDDHSRLCLDSRARLVFKGLDVNRRFVAIAAEHGDPASVLTDNGAVFTGKPRRGGRVALEIELDLLGVRFHHSRPYHPQTCGKVERFHQTQKKWLAAQRPAATLTDLQRQLDRFRDHYNRLRPHRAAGRRTPQQAFNARPKAQTTKPSIPAHYRVRRDKVDTGGVITLRYDSQLRHIGLGREHRGKRVLALIADLYIRVVDAENGELLRELILDPQRDYQPLGRPPGPRPQHR